MTSLQADEIAAGATAPAAGSVSTPTRRSASGRGPKRVRPRAIPELALVVTLFLVYKAGRVAADGHVGTAFADERSLWRLERWLHLPNEVSVQHALLSSHALVHIANCYYAWVHFPVSAAFLIWIYIYRPDHYTPMRRLMALVTVCALIVHVTFPLAPPRMITSLGMVDTAAVYGPSVYGSPATDTLSNQYAAMPSLHVGWALIVAVGLIQASRTRWRWLWTLYPIATFLVVVGTANHYWLDGLVAVVMVATIAPIPGILRSRPPRAVRQATRTPATRTPQIAPTMLRAFAALPPVYVAPMDAASKRAPWHPDGASIGGSAYRAVPAGPCDHRAATSTGNAGA